MQIDEVREFEVQPVKAGKGLSADELKKWKAGLMQEMKDALIEFEPRYEQWKICVAMYNAQLKRKDAGERDADMDYTISFELAKEAKVRLINPVLAYPQIFYPKERRKAFVKMAEAHDDFSNWIEDQTDWVTLCDDMTTQEMVFGSSFVKVAFTRETMKSKAWEVDEYGTPKEKTTEIVYSEGPTPRICHTPNMLYPAHCGDSVQKARWIAERFYSDEEEVTRLEKAKTYDKGFSKHKSNSDGPDSKLEIGPAPAEDEPKKRKLRELWEVYTTLPDGTEVVATIDLENEVYGRLVYNWLHWYFRPYAHGTWKKKVSTLDGTSLMELLEGGHRAYQGIMNMTLDAGSRALEKLIIGSSDLGLMKYFKNGRLDTGFVEVDASSEEVANGIREFKVSEGFTSLQWILDKLVQHMRHVASIPEAFQGQDVANRPTAHGTAEILAEARQPLNFELERFRKFLADIHTMQYARYRQFFPAGVEFYVQSQKPEDQSLLWQTMKWPEGIWQQQIAFEVKCSSKNSSRDARRQQLMSLLDAVPNTMKGVLEFASAAVSSEPIAMVAAQATAVLTGLVKEFLDEFDIEGAEAFNPMQGIDVGQQFNEVVQQMQGQIQKLQGQLQRLLPPPPEPLQPGQGGPQLPQGQPGMGGPPPMG